MTIAQIIKRLSPVLSFRLKRVAKANGIRIEQAVLNCLMGVYTQDGEMVIPNSDGVFIWSKGVNTQGK